MKARTFACLLLAVFALVGCRGGDGGNKNTGGGDTGGGGSGGGGAAPIAGGLYHSLAVKTDGTVWAWGFNLYGQLGDGTTADKAAPVRVSGI